MVRSASAEAAGPAAKTSRREPKKAARRNRRDCTEGAGVMQDDTSSASVPPAAAKPPAAPRGRRSRKVKGPVMAPLDERMPLDEQMPAVQDAGSSLETSTKCRNRSVLDLRSPAAEILALSSPEAVPLMERLAALRDMGTAGIPSFSAAEGTRARLGERKTESPDTNCVLATGSIGTFEEAALTSCRDSESPGAAMGGVKAASPMAAPPRYSGRAPKSHGTPRQTRKSKASVCGDTIVLSEAESAQKGPAAARFGGSSGAWELASPCASAGQRPPMAGQSLNISPCGDIGDACESRGRWSASPGVLSCIASPVQCTTPRGASAGDVVDLCTPAVSSCLSPDKAAARGAVPRVPSPLSCRPLDLSPPDPSADRLISQELCGSPSVLLLSPAGPYPVSAARAHPSSPTALQSSGGPLEQRLQGPHSGDSEARGGTEGSLELMAAVFGHVVSPPSPSIVVCLKTCPFLCMLPSFTGIHLGTCFECSPLGGRVYPPPPPQWMSTQIYVRGGEWDFVFEN